MKKKNQISGQLKANRDEVKFQKLWNKLEQVEGSIVVVTEVKPEKPPDFFPDGNPNYKKKKIEISRSGQRNSITRNKSLICGFIKLLYLLPW